MNQQEIIDNFITMCNSAKLPKSVLLFVDKGSIEIVTDGKIATFTSNGDIIDNPASVIDNELMVGDFYVGNITDMLNLSIRDLTERLSKFVVYTQSN